MIKSFSTIILSIVFIAACEQQSPIGLKTNFYDSIEAQNLTLLDSLRLRQYDDSARWRLYTLHCDDTVNENNVFFSVSSLNLKLVYVKSTNDTLDLLYSFMLNDTTPVSKYSDGKYLTEGIQFKTSDSIVTGFIRGEAIVTQIGSRSRFVNPLQPEVIFYINKNRDHLHPWFRQEAKRKGILQ